MFRKPLKKAALLCSTFIIRERKLSSISNFQFNLRQPIHKQSRRLFFTVTRQYNNSAARDMLNKIRNEYKIGSYQDAGNHLLRFFREQKKEWLNPDVLSDALTLSAKVELRDIFSYKIDDISYIINKIKCDLEEAIELDSSNQEAKAILEEILSNPKYKFCFNNIKSPK